MARTAAPAVIQRFFDATNAGDSPGFVDCFTPDAFLDDWGSKYDGHDGIARWNQTDNIGVGSRLTAFGIAPDGYDWRVSVSVSGRGFNGEGTMRFTLKDGKIARLVIS